VGAILLARASRSVILPSREMPAPHYLLKITDVTGHKSLVEMPKTYSRDRVVTGIGLEVIYRVDAQHPPIPSKSPGQTVQFPPMSDYR
jgi:hypothetical protein